jgi:hypothetical protein
MSVVVVVFQNVFYSEKHQNIYFYFLKIIFNISVLKYQEIKKNKKNFNFFQKYF